MKSALAAVADVISERRRQVEAEDWTPEHDDDHATGDLAVAGACYAMEGSSHDVDSHFPRTTLPDGVPKAWPWSDDWWKPKDRRRNLVRAAALIIAEIERLDRRG